MLLHQHINCKAYTSYRGLTSSGSNCSFNNNHFHNSENYGVSLSGKNNTFMGNHIVHCAQWGAGVGISGLEDSTLSFNTIIGIGGSYPNLGFYGDNGDTDCVILFNTFQDVDNEIYQCNARVNCTGYDDWNFYTGVS